MDKGKKAVAKSGAQERKPRSVSKSADTKKQGDKNKRSVSKANSKARGRSSVAKKGADKKGDKNRKESKKRQSSKSRGKKEEDDNQVKPKRPQSDYIFFSNEMVPKLKSEKGIDHRAAMAEAGKLWGEMSDAQKQKYKDMNAKDKERYEKQLKELKEKGYFTHADGTKSTEDQAMSGKKKAQRSAKKTTTSKKKSSIVDKSMRSEKTAEKKKGGKGQTKKSQDDLDVESEEQSVEDSA